MSGYLQSLGAELRTAPPPPTRGFAAALTAGPSVAVIAEVKRASPSQGAIAPDASIAGTAAEYARSGAAAMSVLCAARDFGGSLEHLTEARASSPLPALAKDFTLFPDQVAAQRMAGADAILVILAMVSDSEARRLIDLAELLGMDTLVEVHDASECERAVGLEAAVIGVNARDLETMEIDTTRQRELIASLPPTAVRIAESGIDSRTGVEAARDAGADAVLVGTALMRDPALLPEIASVQRR